MCKQSKLCIIIPTLKMGGMERVASLLSNYAIDYCSHVDIVCLMREKIDFELDERIIVHMPRSKYKKGLLGKLKVFLFLVRKLRFLKPTVALSFSEVFNPLSIVCAMLTRTRIFISDRSNPYLNHRLTTRILRRSLYPFSNGMISQTSEAKEVAINKNYNRNIVVIPNPLRKIANNEYVDRKKVVISVGRLVKSKNFDALIEMFLIANKRQDWQLWILGDGPERNKLVEKISNLGAENTVKLIGEVKDVDYYLSQASIFAYASLSEGFPNALSEAIASPLPCVVYDCPAGPSELVVNNKNGYLVPLQDENRFTMCLESLFQDSNIRERFIDNHIEHRKKYEVEHICSQYLDVLIDR